MEDKTKIWSLVTVLLISIGGNVYQVNNDLIDVTGTTHVCIEEEMITNAQWCDHISGGIGTRCYKTESSRSNWKTCSTGWQKIDLISSNDNINSNKIICTPNGCE